VIERRSQVVGAHGVVDVADERRLAHRQVGTGQHQRDAAGHPVGVAHHEVGHIGGQPGGVEGQVGPVLRQVVEAHAHTLPGTADGAATLSTGFAPGTGGGPTHAGPQNLRQR
jgi:hypothetical protein